MSDKHEKARELGEEAREALDQGDEKTADALIDQAKKLVEDLEEGAGDTKAE